MPTLEPFGAKFLVRGGAFTTVEGEMPFERIAVLEFPPRGAADAWYQSDAYQAVLPIRLASELLGPSSTPSAGVELDRLDDRCRLGDDVVETLLGRNNRDRQGGHRHALGEVDEVET
jgi:hypothetical protein